MFKKVFEKINDSKLRILLFKNKIDIINYNKILIMESNKIVVDCKELVLSIKGNNLIITKLYNKELLITGLINNIEMK